MKRPDGIIFDMDGTLWDAVDSYARVWNRTFHNLGLEQHATVTREDLVRCMGLPLDAIFDRIGGGDVDREEFIRQLYADEQAMMPRLGGVLYPGVEHGIPALAKRYPLFMVSNCSASGLPNFLHYTHLGPYITDCLANGDNGLPKWENIRLMARRHGLRNPVYVGDTQGDADQCRLAGVDFIHARWGFGKVPDARCSAGSFDELTAKLLNL